MTHSDTPVSPRPRVLEDPLTHLPSSSVAAYDRGQLIYRHDQRPDSLYLVIEGKVKVSRPTRDGREVIIDIYQAEEFLGESALLDLPERSEEATALENTRLMAWSNAEIKEIIIRRPKLGIALLQVLVQRTIDFSHRIESFSQDSNAHRLARTLLRFSERMGTPDGNGTVRMVGITHLLLSQYVGTSREIVTGHMNQFRRQGYLGYSRRGIVLDRDALRKWLQTLSPEGLSRPAETNTLNFVSHLPSPSVAAVSR